jgi:glutamate formiminotransferase/formiminotetrahydrofolate cyclodeaminase
MNLTNFHKTPIALVVEAIRREAARYGVMIHHAELVGLIPESALVDAAAWYLQLDQFHSDQILEQKLFTLIQSSQTQSIESPAYGTGFLDALAAGTATPGGGSAAAYAGAAAAGLVSMVARLTIGKKKYAEFESRVQTILTQAEALRNDLTQFIQLDSSAFESVMSAYKLPKQTSEQQDIRRKAIQQATLLATQVPMGVANKSLRVLEQVEQIIPIGNETALSDAATGASLAKAAIKGAGYNIRINARELPDELSRPYLTELAGIEQHAATIEGRIQVALHERGL